MVNVDITAAAAVAACTYMSYLPVNVKASGKCAMIQAARIYIGLHAHLNCCICKMYLCLRIGLRIGDLRAPQRLGKNHGREIAHLRQ